MDSHNKDNTVSTRVILMTLRTFILQRRSGVTNPMQWASFQMRKITVCVCAGNARNVFPATDFKRKPLVSHPDVHHGTCVTGSLTRGRGENVPGIPGASAPAISRTWQKAHARMVGLWHLAHFLSGDMIKYQVMWWKLSDKRLKYTSKRAAYWRVSARKTWLYCYCTGVTSSLH